MIAIRLDQLSLRSAIAANSSDSIVSPPVIPTQAITSNQATHETAADGAPGQPARLRPKPS